MKTTPSSYVCGHSSDPLPTPWSPPMPQLLRNGVISNDPLGRSISATSPIAPTDLVGRKEGGVVTIFPGPKARAQQPQLTKQSSDHHLIVQYIPRSPFCLREFGASLRGVCHVFASRIVKLRGKCGTFDLRGWRDAGSKHGW